MGPNPYLGDAQLWALASWLRTEEVKDEEVKRTMDGELKESIRIRTKHPNPSILPPLMHS